MDHQGLKWLQMAVLVVLLVLLLTKPGFSQTNDRDNNTNVFIIMYCGEKLYFGQNAVMSLPNLNKNHNLTFNELRTELLSKRVLYARAQALSAGDDSVFAAAQCRNYLSVDQCVSCFDTAVAQLVTNCSWGTSAYISYDNCFVRYEDSVDFYNNPYVMEYGNGWPRLSCGKQSASQPTIFNQVVDGFLSDVRHATPKTSNFYVASTRNITSENATVYVTAQCAESVNKAICQNCMNRAYDGLNDCLPNTEGRFFDMGCFARYSTTPFFNANQTIDITNVLKGHSSKVSVIIATVVGVILFILIVLSWFLYRSWKKSKRTEQDMEVVREQITPKGHRQDIKHEPIRTRKCDSLVVHPITSFS
ncbi:hypothetical protein QVD17_37100 [Tagetes erecta]|uniref:Gnk2-homologous domain-containing protein n=1 Tax=Tagetes erecta TaxID=13708 RepID=A0AAD8JVE0_TARER|nr:hypothetical protein QVD17_37100 [Tagetes erecta]